MKIRHLVASQPRVKTQTSKDGIGHRSAAAVRTLAGLHASQPSIAVFPILADVVEVKTGSGSTVHWPIHFIRLNGWLRHSFVQLITLLDIDSIGQNWEDRKKHDKCTNVIGQRWSLGRSIEPIEGRTGSSFCRSQGTVERRRRRRWRPVAPRTRLIQQRLQPRFEGSLSLRDGGGMRQLNTIYQRIGINGTEDGQTSGARR